jgi:hypothetical protein
MTAAKTPEPTGLALLRVAFPPHQVGKLPKQMKRDDQDKGKCEQGSRFSADGTYCGGWHARSLHLDFVGHAALTDRLLDADPEWSWEPVAFGPDGLPMFDRNGGLWIRLTVCGVTRLGYGDAQGKTGPNAVKEAIGDGLRNAGMRFGIALDLWHKGDLHVDQQEPADRPADRGPAAADPWQASDPVAVEEWKQVLAAASDKDSLASAWADLNVLCSTGQVTTPDRIGLVDLWNARKAEVLAADGTAAA